MEKGEIQVSGYKQDLKLISFMVVHTVIWLSSRITQAWWIIFLWKKIRVLSVDQLSGNFWVLKDPYDSKTKSLISTYGGDTKSEAVPHMAGTRCPQDLQ